MRQENYFIALFNKDVLPLGFFFQTFFLTKMMELDLQWGVFRFVFKESMALNDQFIQHFHRDYLATELKKRFRMMALLHLVLSPFLFLFLVVYIFFQLGADLHRNVEFLGSRDYTRYARWKFRDFNELPHLFEKR